MSSTRTFLKIALETGLECGTVTPEDIVAHVDAYALSSSLPVADKAKLLDAALASETMTPALIVDTVGIPSLAQHIAVHLLWSCIADTAARALGETTATTTDDKAAKKGPPPAPGAKPQAKGATKDETGPIPVVDPKDAKPTKASAKKSSRKSSRRRPARLAPRASSDSEFEIDIDTDVGEEWPTERTAETLGAAPLDDMGDWQGDGTARKP